MKTSGVVLKAGPTVLTAFRIPMTLCATAGRSSHVNTGVIILLIVEMAATKCFAMVKSTCPKIKQ